MKSLHCVIYIICAEWWGESVFLNSLIVLNVVDHVLSPHADVQHVPPVPDMVVLLMSQLQPVLEGFNRSLEHLGRQVKVLVQDMADLKENHLREGTEGDNLDEVFQQIGTVRRQMEDQRRNMENVLHSQHALLHQNLSSFKMDVNLKLKHHQKLLQVRDLLQIPSSSQEVLLTNISDLRSVCRQ